MPSHPSDRDPNDRRRPPRDADQRKRRPADDADEDRPRARKPRRDDDDEEDQPRARRRPSRDEETRPPPRRRPTRDEDEERPRRGRSRDDDDDEDDDEEEEEEEVREVKWTPRRSQLNLVQIGLTFLLVAQFIHIGEAVIGTLQRTLLAGLGENSEFVVFMGNYIAMPLAGIVMICQLTGLILNCFVPSKAEGRGLVIGAIVLNVLPIILSAVGLYVRYGDDVLDIYRTPRLMELLGGVSFVSYIASICVTMLYLRQVAYYLKDVPLGNTAAMLVGVIVLIILAVPAAIVATFLLVIIGAFIPGGGFIVIGAVVLMWVAWLGALVRFEIKIIQVMMGVRQLALDQIYPRDDD